MLKWLRRQSFAQLWIDAELAAQAIAWIVKSLRSRSLINLVDHRWSAYCEGSLMHPCCSVARARGLPLFWVGPD